MTNQTNTSFESAAELEAAYPTLCKHIREEAAKEERLRLKQLYTAASAEDGEALMILAAFTLGVRA
jgi:hypothetical protein